MVYILYNIYIYIHGNLYTHIMYNIIIYMHALQTVCKSRVYTSYEVQYGVPFGSKLSRQNLPHLYMGQSHLLSGTVTLVSGTVTLR